MKEARHDDAVEEALGPLCNAQGERVLRPGRNLPPSVAEIVADTLERNRRLTKRNRGWWSQTQ